MILYSVTLNFNLVKGLLNLPDCPDFIAHGIFDKAIETKDNKMIYFILDNHLDKIKSTSSRLHTSFIYNNISDAYIVPDKKLVDIINWLKQYYFYDLPFLARYLDRKEIFNAILGTFDLSSDYISEMILCIRKATDNTVVLNLLKLANHLGMIVYLVDNDIIFDLGYYWSDILNCHVLNIDLEVFGYLIKSTSVDFKKKHHLTGINFVDNLWNIMNNTFRVMGITTPEKQSAYLHVYGFPQLVDYLITNDHLSDKDITCYYTYMNVKSLVKSIDKKKVCKRPNCVGSAKYGDLCSKHAPKKRCRIRECTRRTLDIESGLCKTHRVARILNNHDK